jgi:hypothetical protein
MAAAQVVHQLWVVVEQELLLAVVQDLLEETMVGVEEVEAFLAVLEHLEHQEL